MTLCQIKFNKNKTKRFLPNANVTIGIIVRKKIIHKRCAQYIKYTLKINIFLHKKRFAFNETRPRDHNALLDLSLNFINS